MNTPLPVNPRRSDKPAILTAQQKITQAQPGSPPKTVQGHPNLSLRYPKDLERCFVLGNN